MTANANLTVLSDGSTTPRDIGTRFADVVNVMDYGALGDGSTDDHAAFVAAISEAISNGINYVVAPRNHYIGSPLLIDGTSYAGFRLEINRLTAKSSFSAGSYLPYLIIVGSGSATTSQLANIEIKINYLNGNSVAGGILNYGAAFSKFYIGEGTQCTFPGSPSTIPTTPIAVYATINSTKFTTNDNIIHGNVLTNNDWGVYCDVNSGTLHCEHTQVNFNFIANSNYAGFFLRGGSSADANYGAAFAAFDLNGDYLHELQITSGYTDSSLDLGSTVTGDTSGATGVVVAKYTRYGLNYILVQEGYNRTHFHASGETLNSAHATMAAITNGEDSSAYYFDIVSATPASSGGFTRNTFVCPFLERIVGDYIITDNIFSFNGVDDRNIYVGALSIHNNTLNGNAYIENAYTGNTVMYFTGSPEGIKIYNEATFSGATPNVYMNIGTNLTLWNDTLGGGGWNTPHFAMGGYQLWVDSSGNLRIKSGTPTSDTDGTVVGTQTPTPTSQIFRPNSDICNGLSTPPYMTGDPDGEGYDYGDTTLNYYGPNYNGDDVLGPSSGSTMYGAMDQGVIEPTVPSSAPYMQAVIPDSDQDDLAWEVACDVSGLTLSGTLTLTLWVYAVDAGSTGEGGYTIWGNLAVDGSILTWGQLYTGTNSAGGWYSLTFTASATAVAAGLHIMLDVQQNPGGFATSTAVNVLAAYVLATT